METICPVCKVKMDTVDDRSVRCRVHGEVFQVLFRRASAEPPVPAPAAPADTPFAAAVVNGSESDGLLVEAPVPDVTASAAVSAPPPLPVSEPGSFQARNGGVRCVQHPAVPATGQCSSCGGFFCATCDFPLPGGGHVCPSCAVASQESLSPKRARARVWAFVLAIWSSLAMAAVMSGALAGAFATEAGEQAMGFLFLLLVLAPSVIGFSLGMGAINRRLVNPPSLWIGTMWNALIAVIFIVLCVIGLMS